jgi:hypothetical protein
MSGLKRRLSRRRAAEPESAAEPPAAAAAPAEPAAEPSLLSDPAAPATSEGATEPLPITELPVSAEPAPATPALPADDLPAGLDADELAAHPDSSARRGRLRRRIEFLRSARELLLRDLGGFVYEIHRTAGDHEHEAHKQLRATKLDRLSRIDTELHELEARLGDVRRHVVVSEPGVGGECPECGELFGSAAHYCSHCGLPLTESARRAFSRIVAAQPAVAEAPPQPAPAPIAADQQTQELPPLAAEPGTVFHWPPREAEPEEAKASDEPAPDSEAKPDGEDEKPAEDPKAAEDATPSGEDANAGDEDAKPGDEDAKPGDDPLFSRAERRT